MIEGIDRTVDLVGARTSGLTGAADRDVVAAIRRCDAAALGATDGHFAAIARDGRTVRLARTATPWTQGYVLPNLDYGLAYRVMSSLAYPKIKEIIENTLASALIYLPSSALDFKVPELRPYLDQFVRGSNGYTAEARVKLMKLLWDAIGTEFGGRHELYERNYFGNHESIRFETLMVADITGASARYKGFAEQCMAEYNLDGWVSPDLVANDDVSAIAKKMTT